MKTISFAGAALAAVLLARISTLHAAAYHVDSVAGNDGNSGASPAEAWRSLEKVNATTLQPGDKVLLKSWSAPSMTLHQPSRGPARQVA